MYSVIPSFISLFLLTEVKSAVAGTLSTLCYGFDAVESSSGDYTWTPDIWADDGSGALCLTADTKTTAFNASWSWYENADSVHSYPHVVLNSDALPAAVASIESLTISTSWGMTLESDEDYGGFNVANLASAEVAANVAIDMFLDPNPTAAQNPDSHMYEIMVWFGQIGEAYPIGFYDSDGYQYSQMMGGVNFNLYQGYNGEGTLVFTWLADTNLTSFSHDLSPLIQYIWKNGLISGDNYLGVVAFGSENFHSNDQVRFSAVSGVQIDLVPGTPPALAIEKPKVLSKRDVGKKLILKKEAEPEAEAEKSIVGLGKRVMRFMRGLETPRF